VSVRAGLSRYLTGAPTRLAVHGAPFIASRAGVRKVTRHTKRAIFQSKDFIRI